MSGYDPDPDHPGFRRDGYRIAADSAPPVDAAPEPGDTFIVLRDGVPYIGTEPAVKGSRYTDVTDLLTVAAAGHYDPKQLRDPHTGKWIRDPAGHYLDEAVKGLGYQQRVSHNGHVVDRTKTGYTVKLKSGEKQSYSHAGDAAEAARRGTHLRSGELKFGEGHLPGAEPKPEPPKPEPPKPAGKAVRIPTLPAGYTAHEGATREGVKQPDVLISDQAGQQVARLKYVEIQHQKLNSKGLRTGYTTEKGYKYELTHAGVVEDQKNKRAEALKRGDAYVPKVNLTGGYARPLPETAKAAVVHHEDLLSKLKPEPPKPEPPKPDVADVKVGDRIPASQVKVGMMVSNPYIDGETAYKVTSIERNHSRNVKFHLEGYIAKYNGTPGSDEYNAAPHTKLKVHALPGTEGKPEPEPTGHPAAVHAITRTLSPAAQRKLGSLKIELAPATDKRFGNGSHGVQFRDKILLREDANQKTVAHELVHALEQKSSGTRLSSSPEWRALDDKIKAGIDSGQIGSDAHYEQGLGIGAQERFAELGASYLLGQPLMLGDDQKPLPSGLASEVSAYFDKQGWKAVAPEPKPSHVGGGIKWTADGSSYHQGTDAAGNKYVLKYAAGGGWDVHEQPKNAAHGRVLGPKIGHGKNAAEAKTIAEAHAAGTVIPDKGVPEPEPAGKVIPSITRKAPAGQQARELWLREQAAPAAQASVEKIYGTTATRWNGTTFIKQQNQWYGVMQWDGRMGLAPKPAQGLTEALDPRPGTVVSDVNGIKTYLHEINHAVGSGEGTSINQEVRDYMTKTGHDQEEGFTELGAWLHMPAFLKHLGIDGKQTKAVSAVKPEWEQRAARVRVKIAAIRQGMYETSSPALREKLAHAQHMLDGQQGGVQAVQDAIGALNEAGHGADAAALQRHLDVLKEVPAPAPLTLGDYYGQYMAPEWIATGRAPGMGYAPLVKQAYSYLDQIAQRELVGPKMTRSAGTPASRFTRVQELSLLVNARSGPGKRQAMVNMYLDAMGIPQLDRGPVVMIELDAVLNSHWDGPNGPVDAMDAELRNMRSKGYFG